MESAIDKALIRQLYDTVLQSKKVNLTEMQSVKFLWACEKAIAENPDLDFNGWTIAAKIYLNFVLNFPSMELGPIVMPGEE